jgi:hypothetical protein
MSKDKDYVRVSVRFPRWLYNAIMLAAKTNQRSINKQVIFMLMSLVGASEQMEGNKP